MDDDAADQEMPELARANIRADTHQAIARVYGWLWTETQTRYLGMAMERVECVRLAKRARDIQSKIERWRSGDYTVMPAAIMERELREVTERLLSTILGDDHNRTD